MTQLAIGLARKQRGQDTMESLDHEWITKAREYAKNISLAMGSVTTDAIQMMVRDGEMPAPTKPQAYGSIFRGKHWMYFGRERSVIVTNHGRFVVLWRWID